MCWSLSASLFFPLTSILYSFLFFYFILIYYTYLYFFSFLYTLYFLRWKNYIPHRARNIVFFCFSFAIFEMYTFKLIDVLSWITSYEDDSVVSFYLQGNIDSTNRRSNNVMSLTPELPRKVSTTNFPLLLHVRPFTCCASQHLWRRRLVREEKARREDRQRPVTGSAVRCLLTSATWSNARGIVWRRYCPSGAATWFRFERIQSSRRIGRFAWNCCREKLQLHTSFLSPAESLQIQ